MILSGKSIISEFLRQHGELRNQRIRRYLLRHEWALAAILPAHLPGYDDPRLTEADPYERAIDIIPQHVDELAAQIRAGVPLPPAIADDNLVFLDGNHRAIACRIVGAALPAFVPVAKT